VLKRMLVLGDCEKIADELLESTAAFVTTDKPAASSASPHDHNSFLDVEKDITYNSSSFSLKSVRKKAVDHIEKEVISQVLKSTDWNRSKASKILKVSYKTLLNKIAELNILPPSGRSISD